MNFTANSSSFHFSLSAVSKLFPRVSVLSPKRNFHNRPVHTCRINDCQKIAIRSASTNNPTIILDIWLKNKSRLPAQDGNNPPKLERSLSDLVAIATTNYFPGAFSKSDSAEWNETSINDFAQFHVYSSGMVSETIIFEFAACENRVFYQVGAAKIILMELSENVLNQSCFLGAATGSIVASALKSHQDMDQLFEKLLDEFVTTGLIKGNDVEEKTGVKDALTIRITVEPGKGNICPSKELGAISPLELFEQGQADAMIFLKTLQSNEFITSKLFK